MTTPITTATIDADLNLPPEFPLYTRGDTRSAIAAQQGALGLRYWGEAIADYAVENAGKIETLTDVLGGDETFSQATAANRAVLTAAQVNGFPGLVFDGADDHYLWSEGYDLGATWTLLALFRHNSGGGAGGRGILGQYSASNSQRGLYRTSGGDLFALHRSANINLGPIASDTWHLAIVAASGDNFWAKLNDGEWQASSSSGADPTATLCLGTHNAASPGANAWPGTEGAWQIFNKCLAAPTLADGSALITEHFRASYDLW